MARKPRSVPAKRARKGTKKGRSADEATFRGDEIIKLPAEIFLELLKILPKADWKTLRFVSKPLNALVIAELFGSIFISGIAIDLDHANEICLRFGDYIKTVYVSPMAYKPLGMMEYSEIVKEAFNRKDLRKITWRPHLHKGWENYCSLRQAAEKIFSSGEITVFLCQALTHAKRVRRVVLTDANRQRNISDVELCKVCPQQDSCKADPELHKHYWLPPTILWHNTKTQGNSDVIHSVFLAMSTASTHVKDFTMEFSEKDQWLDAHCFDMMPRQVHHTFNVLSRLAKLKLNLTYNPYKREHAVIFQDKRIAKTLSGATNLEVLFIETNFATCDITEKLGVTAQKPKYRRGVEWGAVGDLRGTGFGSILGGCHLPNLEVFFMSMVDVDAQELLDFLGRIKWLKRLAIKGCVLKSGSWQDITAWTMAHGHLQNTSLDQTNYGAELTKEEDEGSTGPSQRLEDAVTEYYRAWF